MGKRRRIVCCIVVGLLVLWGLWYARPLDVSALTGERDLYGFNGVVRCAEARQDGRWGLDCRAFGFLAGEAEMDALNRQLETLRFRRNPLEVVLRYLPREGASLCGYAFDLYGFGQDGAPFPALRFDGEHWAHGDGLPLYASGETEEAGARLGEWLWAHGREFDR